MPLTMVVQKLVSSNMSSTLLAVPLFMMIGTVMNYAGITNNKKTDDKRKVYERKNGRLG